MSDETSDEQPEHPSIMHGTEMDAALTALAKAAERLNEAQSSQDAEAYRLALRKLRYAQVKFMRAQLFAPNAPTPDPSASE